MMVVVVSWRWGEGDSGDGSGGVVPALVEVWCSYCLWKGGGRRVGEGSCSVSLSW